MIRLNKVFLRLGKTDRSSSVQFQLAEFEVAKGEMIALTGPSGCGKSTLLNIVSGLRGADKGEVTVAGVDLMTLSPAQLDRHRGTHCGMIFQTFHLLAPFTALENVSIGLRFGARNHANPKKRSIEVLNRVGLGDRIDARPAELSVGQRQRVAIARAIAGNASILLADEPTGALDPKTGQEIFHLLKEIAEEDNRTLLMVTHDSALASKMARTFDCSRLIDYKQSTSEKEIAES
jgi:ABC-type lipoprotein export system ATPase subunit